MCSARQCLIGSIDTRVESALAPPGASPSQVVPRPSPSTMNRRRVAIRRRRPGGRAPDGGCPWKSTAPISNSRAYCRSDPHRLVSFGRHCSTAPFESSVPGERTIRAHRRPRRSLAPQEPLDRKPRRRNRNSGHASGTRSEHQVILKYSSALWITSFRCNGI